MITIGAVTGLSMGTTVLLGQRIGSGDDDGAAETVGNSIIVFAVLAIVLSIVMFAAAPGIASLMKAPGEAFSQTTDYIRIGGGGSLFIVAYNLLSAVFRGMGDSRSPLIFVTIACIVNIAGDIILVYGFGMGAAGAAVATVAAQAVSIRMSFILIKPRSALCALAKHHLRLRRKTTAAVIRLGAPIALSDTCSEVSYLIIIEVVNIVE